MIDLHYWPTPNGKKVTILLEEAGIPYRIVPVNIGRGDQFSAEFLRMNPNHRMTHPQAAAGRSWCSSPAPS
jgi:GST-like protein